MVSIEENIESLSRALLGDAKSDAAQAFVDAKAKADAILQRAQEQAAAQRVEIIARAQSEADRLHSQAIATTQMKARTMELDHREKMLDHVFTESRKQIAGVQHWTDFAQIAARLLKEALAQLKSNKAVVRADAETQKYLTPSVMSKISQELGMEITFGEPLSQGTGVVVETVDGHLQYDNTLETRLNRLQNSLRSTVYQLMNGETHRIQNGESL
jgi:vacuolar-type H+-ATPase subunit E/Vma4